MTNKNYAYLMRRIFGEKSILIDDRAINEDAQLGELIEEITQEFWEPFDMEYIAIHDYLLRGRGDKEFRHWIIKNADQLAKKHISLALRRLRHPRQSRRLRPHFFIRNHPCPSLHHPPNGCTKFGA